MCRNVSFDKSDARGLKFYLQDLGRIDKAMGVFITEKLDKRSV